MHPSFCPETSNVIIQAAKKADLENVLKETGTIVTVEGPRFSSRAESFMFKSWNAGTYIHTYLLGRAQYGLHFSREKREICSDSSGETIKKPDENHTSKLHFP